jgi:hypothetical protein
MTPPRSAEHPAGPASRSGQIPDWVPIVIYLLIAAATLGLAAVTASSNMIADQPNKDIWQHVAAVRALMENLAEPRNPFVVSPEPSRHFQPLWVATAVVGNALNLTVWQAVAGATFTIMLTLAFAIHFFARTVFESPWAPSVLLCVMLFAWSAPYEHTGLHSFWTLLYAAAYPATFMIALSLLLWAMVIRALDDTRYLPALVLLSAVMLATHQLGAVIGFIGAFSFAAAQPGAPVMRRLGALAAGSIGLAVALAWPYFNPVQLMLQGSDSAWVGGPDFYSPPWMPQILLPAAIGLLWLRHRKARPLALALGLYLGLYLLGLFGVQIAARFLMPVVLVLHVALAGLLLEAMTWVRLQRPVLRQSAPWLATAGVVTLAAIETIQFQARFEFHYAAAPDIYVAAERMTSDIPDNEEIAAFGLTAWPVVAAGQRVLSVPWPEPGIADLAERQAMTEALFDTALSPAARRAMAEELGIRVLITDRRYVSPDLLEALAEMAISASQDGTLHRFDVWE